MRPVCLRQGILSGQEALSSRTVPLPLGIFLEGIGDCDGTVAKILSIHGLDGSVRRIKASKVDKSVTLGIARVGVTHDLGGLKDNAKGTEGIVQKLLVDLGVQVANEDVGAHVQVLVVGRGLVDPDRLPVQLDHVHDFDRIVGILLT